MSRCAAIAGVLLVGVTGAAVTACGGGEHEPAGYVRDPAPVVGDLSLPDVAADGEPFALRADPGEILVVYFGYTNCPDYCPTTMSDVRLAREQLDDPEQIDVAMITVDPERDLPVLADYVAAFFPDGHALGTTDAGALAKVAGPFGSTYEVVTGDDGEVEVGHRTDLYAVDDQGRLALTWSFGTEIDALAADFEFLLDQEGA